MDSDSVKPVNRNINFYAQQDVAEWISTLPENKSGDCHHCTQINEAIKIGLLISDASINNQLLVPLTLDQMDLIMSSLKMLETLTGSEDRKAKLIQLKLHFEKPWNVDL